MAGYRELQAVVLSARDQGEADRRLALLTPTGRIVARAPGTRKVKSRLGGVLQPPAFVSLTLYERGTLRTVTGAATIESFAGIRDDLRRLAASQVLLEICDVTAGEEDALSPFLALVAGLRDLAGPGEPGWSLLRAELRLLAAYGWGLQFGRCVTCGRPPRPPLHYAVDLGGVSCGACAPQGLDVSAQAMEALSRAGAGQGPGGDAQGARGILHVTWQARLERRLESARFAEEVIAE